jgi:DNA mismatch repair protein MutL
VMSAYREMIAADSFPMYALFIDLDPARVDVNVHPTKQEIKFEDEKLAYAFVQAAVKHALAQFSVMPALDFDLDASIQQLPSIQQPFTQDRQSAAAATPIFKGFTEKHQAHFIERSDKGELKHWKEFYEGPVPGVVSQEQEGNTENTAGSKENTGLTGHHSLLAAHQAPFTTQLHNEYILAETDNGFILINQQAAHERVLYEQLGQALQGKSVASQRSLFPVTLELQAADTAILQEIKDDLQLLGYIIEPFGKNTFVIQGTPADVDQGNENVVIESLLEQFKNFTSDVKFSKREKLLRAAAWQQSVKAGKRLEQREMQRLVEDLFACKQPNMAPNGNPVYLEFKNDQLEKMFGK